MKEEFKENSIVRLNDNCYEGEKHRGKYFTVIKEVGDDLIKCQWKDDIEYFYRIDLELIKTSKMDYKKLFKDKAESKIDERMVIVFDNDGGFWMCKTDNNDEAERMCEEYEKRYGIPDGYSDLVDIMIAAGFKAEWC